VGENENLSPESPVLSGHPLPFALCQRENVCLRLSSADTRDLGPALECELHLFQVLNFTRRELSWHRSVSLFFLSSTRS